MTRARSLVTGLAFVVACARDGRPSASPQPVANEYSSHASMQGHPVPPVRNDTAPTEFVDPGAAQPRAIVEAIAVLTPTEGNTARGFVRFSENDKGLELYASVEGLPPGVHAYDVHVYGDCSAPDARSAGPHFHFTGSSLDPSVKMITGHLGDLTQPETTERTDQRIKVSDASLHGPFSIVGRSVVVNAKSNDPTKTPGGAAGARLACGVIGIANPATAERRSSVSAVESRR